MEQLSAINVDHIGQMIKEFIAEDGIYFFAPGLMLFLALCGWIVYHFRHCDAPVTDNPPPVRRGVLFFYPSPIGVFYDPEATVLPMQEPPRLRRFPHGLPPESNGTRDPNRWNF